MLGIKTIKIETKEKLDLEGLYNKIKDVDFMAGKPEYIKHGFNYVIAFPPEDRQNQVWIIATKKGFTVQRSTVTAGVSNMIANTVKADILNDLTGGVTGAISMLGGPKKACVAHCEDVAAKINALGL